MMVLTENIQPIEKKIERQPHDELAVHSIFDTIQGEGPFAGEPATFIRLAGCNLNCKWCDTDYTSKRSRLTPNEINDVMMTMPARRVVVLTGGEPFRQDFYGFFLHCIKPGQILQVETNGTLYRDFLEKQYTEQMVIVCSPKTPAIDDRMWRFINALKYVVEDGRIDETDGLPLSSVGPQYGRPARPPEYWKGVIFVQPLDVQDPVKNLENLKAAAESCMKHNYILTTQIHKEAGLP